MLNVFPQMNHRVLHSTTFTLTYIHIYIRIKYVSPLNYRTFFNFIPNYQILTFVYPKLSYFNNFILLFLTSLIFPSFVDAAQAGPTCFRIFYKSLGAFWYCSKEHMISVGWLGTCIFFLLLIHKLD